MGNWTVYSGWQYAISDCPALALCTKRWPVKQYPLKSDLDFFCKCVGQIANRVHRLCPKLQILVEEYSILDTFYPGKACMKGMHFGCRIYMFQASRRLKILTGPRIPKAPAPAMSESHTLMQTTNKDTNTAHTERHAHTSTDTNKGPRQVIRSALVMMQSINP